MAGQDIHKIAGFHPAHQREDFAGRQVERMQNQAQILVVNQGIETVRAFLGPLNDDRAGLPLDQGFDKSQSLTEGP